MYINFCILTNMKTGTMSEPMQINLAFVFDKGQEKTSMQHGNSVGVPSSICGIAGDCVPSCVIRDVHILQGQVAKGFKEDEPAERLRV